MKTASVKKIGFILFALALAVAFRTPNTTQAAEDPNALQNELKEIERQIAEDQAEIKEIQGQAKTLANTLKELGKQQSLLALQIQSTEVSLEDVETRLQNTQVQIQENEIRRQLLRERMAEILQKIRVADDQSFLYTFISSKNFFEAMNTIQEYKQLAGDLGVVVDKVKEDSLKLKAQEAQLEIAAEEAEQLQALHGLQQASLAQVADSKKTLLAATKGEEAIYQAELGDHKAQAAAIRQRIYQLLGTGKNSITFGEAVKTAGWVSQVTGIEPAFLLSVLSQESDLGTNVGTCNRVGDPPSKNWKQVMKPERDQEPFLAIMEALGRSPEGTPVSCPMRDKAGNQVGWGGAMGPAQFIPSTWIGYAGKVTAVTGAASDPWDIRDAFIAAALKLTADGADGTDKGNWDAAMRYFSGSTDARFRFYGDQVMARAAQYEKDIQELESE